MIPISSLVAAPLPWELRVLTVAEEPVAVTHVSLVEDMTRVDGLAPGALVVCTRATIEAASTYRLDVFVRQAAQREVAAILLRRSTPRSATAEALARRGGVTMLDVDDDVASTVLLDELGTLVAGDLGAALRRVARFAGSAGDLETDDPGEVVAAVADACETPLEYRPGEDTGGSVVHAEDGRAIGVVRARQPGDLDVLVARLAADAATAAIARREHLVVAPVRTASAALGQLLLCSQANLAGVAARAAEVGLDARGWHVAARLTALDSRHHDSSGAIEDEVVRLVAEHGSADAALWTATRPDATVVVVRSSRQRPAPGVTEQVTRVMRSVGERLLESRPQWRIRVGVATQHEGAAGLRLTAEESRAALAAASLSTEPFSAASYQTLGAQRILAEWLTTDTARETVRDLLAPLDAWGPRRAATAVETLHAYLDEQGSLQRAGERLHLHRNAVAYRLDRIRAAGIDLGDADQRFALQLACRARMLRASTSD